MKEIILADKSGFCFGVKRAVDLALNTVKEEKKKIYTLGPLIHNEDAVNYLKSFNVYPINLEEIKNLKENDVVIIRSHGVSLDTYNILKDKKLKIIDATCPYVNNIQKKAQKYHDLKYNIVIVGDKNHPEVKGINGWCNNEAIIAKDSSNLENVPRKVCVLSQTTQRQENWEDILNTLVKKSSEILAFNTICNATNVRQKSAYEVSKTVDVMIIIGGKNSSNTTKLYEICKKNCPNSYHIENAGEIPDEVIINNNIKIGVTAGASTPDWIIKEALEKMNDINNMESTEQLEFMKKNDKQIAIGDKIKGTIIAISNNEVFLNIGYKSDAVLPKSEVSREEDINLNDLFKINDVIEAKIIKLRNEDGNVVLSRSEIGREKAFEEIKKAFENKEIVNVDIKEVVKGGLISSYKGIRVFIPASHIELSHVDDLSVYVNTKTDVNIIEFDENKRSTRIVGSRRDILKNIKLKREQETWDKLKKGDIVEGEVKRLSNFGAFVEIDGVDGLLHVSELSWGRVDKPASILNIGDKIKVYVLDVDKENNKLSLSMKKLTDDPWKTVDVKYPVGNIVLGKVVRFATFGAFVELEPGIDGLVHISQISHKRIDKVEDCLQIGQQIKAKILDVNKEERKIGLSIKEVDEI